MCSVSTFHAAYLLCAVETGNFSICPCPLCPRRGANHQEIWAVKIKHSLGFGGAGARGETIFNPYSASKGNTGTPLSKACLSLGDLFGGSGGV